MEIDAFDYNKNYRLTFKHSMTQNFSNWIEILLNTFWARQNLIKITKIC